MKRYMYYAFISLLAGCAYGSLEGADPTHAFAEDGGVKKDSSPDGKVTPHDAASSYDAGSGDDAMDPPDTSRTTCTLSLTTGVPACDSCLGASCCSENITCGNDPECMDFINCLGSCFPSDGGSPDQMCIDACGTQYPTGESELAALQQCMQSNCMTSCQ